jgi:HAE1 family hydrophobic/amphiphilic exporter-1
MFRTVPQGFIPVQDQGYAIVVIQLPEGAALSRTNDVVLRAERTLREIPGHQGHGRVRGLFGRDLHQRLQPGAIFPVFDPFDARIEHGGQCAAQLVGAMWRSFRAIPRPSSSRSRPRPSRSRQCRRVRLQLQDRDSSEVTRVLEAANELMARSRQTPTVARVFTTFTANTPQVYLEIDRVKARMLNVPIPAIFETLSTNLGTPMSTTSTPSAASGRCAPRPTNVPGRAGGHPALKVRSATGALVPLGTLVEVKNVAGPDLIQRYNLFTSVPLQGDAAPGVSTGTALATMERSPARCCRRARLRVDRDRVPGARHRQHGALHLCARRAARLPGARRAVRKLGAAARHHPGRAYGDALGARPASGCAASTTTF